MKLNPTDYGGVKIESVSGEKSWTGRPKSKYYLK